MGLIFLVVSAENITELSNKRRRTKKKKSHEYRDLRISFQTGSHKRIFHYFDNKVTSTG